MGRESIAPRNVLQKASSDMVVVVWCRLVSGFVGLSIAYVILCTLKLCKETREIGDNYSYTEWWC